MLLVAPADAAVVVALEEAPALVLELDADPQPAITIEMDSAISAASVRIGPPDVVGLMAATVGALRSRAGSAESTSGQNTDLALPSAHGGPAILIVEDDEAIAGGLVRVLEGQGYAVVASGSARARFARPSRRSALVILDLGLPDVDGLDVCRRLRATRPELAILILTARDHELDIVAGLDAGADDYLVKPFRLSELLARIRSHLRRASPGNSDEEEPLQLGDLRLDRSGRRAWMGEEELSLRPKEFDLLTLFATNAGVALTRARIMDAVWETSWLGSTKTLDTHVLSLRNKLGADAIATLRGVGYRFELR